MAEKSRFNTAGVSAVRGCAHCILQKNFRLVFVYSTPSPQNAPDDEFRDTKKEREKQFVSEVLPLLTLQQRLIS